MTRLFRIHNATVDTLLLFDAKSEIRSCLCTRVFEIVVFLQWAVLTDGPQVKTWANNGIEWVDR